MPRKFRIKGWELSSLLKISPAFILLFFIIFYSLFPFLFAQQTPGIPREDPDIIMERIRLYYGLKQYQQVLLESQKLLLVDPDNKMANYYKTRAESRLRDMGLPIPTPVELTPLPTPQISPATPTPIITPVQTQVSELPAFPTIAPPVQTATPQTTSPFLPSSTLAETPVPEVTAVAETTPAPVATQEQPEISPDETPEPVTDRALSFLLKFKQYQETNPALFFGILAGALICLALIFIAAILIIRKIVMKKHISRLEKLTLQAQGQMAETIPLKKEIPEEQPQSTVESPGFDFQIPDLPVPESFDFQTPSPGLPEVESPEAPHPIIPEVTEPADIPSPSTFDQIAPQETPAPDLSDIPSPTAPQTPKPVSSLAKESDFPGLPPDLPTFEEAPSIPSPIPPSDEESEIPALSLEDENPSSDFPLVQESSQEQPLSLDLPSTDEAPSASTTDLEELFLSSSAVDSDKEEAEAVQFPQTPSSKPPVFDQDESAGISIEEALGFEGSHETPKDEVLVPPPEDVRISQNDPGATSMDIDKFLFDATNEDNAETILDVSGKAGQGDSDESEPSFIELESDSNVQQGEVGDLIFDEKSLAETKITKSEPKKQKDSVFAFDSQPVFPSQEHEDDSKIFQQKQPLEISPQEEDKQDKTAIRSVSPSTTKRMDKIMPFDDKERKDHGLRSSGTQDRNESLFQEQFEKGRKAFDDGDWKKAVYYLTVASAIKPDAPDLKDMLSIARENKRSMK